MALSKIYTAFAVPFLASWTITVLGFAALDVLNTNRSPIEPIASISLLTFLACRLIMVSQPDSDGSNSIAHVLTTAHTRSPLNALASLLFAISWLYELLYKSVMMFFVTVFGGVLATAIYTDAFVENGTAVDDEDPETTTALAEIDEVKAKMGVDPTAIIKMIPPRALVYVVALVWFNLATLGLYILRHAWRSLRRVFGSTSREITAEIKTASS
ncbi:uncharacterized protein BJX67DRAFT_85437 [Aspergillus lucknowensis]|uniref:Uncharacterized protein n=1 Tax=Aspergillus lucknowensis TaxID=176173 RepID=A0ABR4LSA1_9EURO